MNYFVGHILFESFKHYLENTDEKWGVSFHQLSIEISFRNQIDFLTSLTIEANKSVVYKKETEIVEKVLAMYKNIRTIDVIVLKCLFDVEAEKNFSEDENNGQ